MGKQARPPPLSGKTWVEKEDDSWDGLRIGEKRRRDLQRFLLADRYVPEGWNLRYDEGGRTYYRNTTTGECRWAVKAKTKSTYKPRGRRGGSGFGSGPNLSGCGDGNDCAG